MIMHGRGRLRGSYASQLSTIYFHYPRDEGDLRAQVSWRRKDGKSLPSGRRVNLEKRAGRLSISGIRYGQHVQLIKFF